MHLHPVIVDRFDELTPHERKNAVAMLHELLATARDAAAGYAVAHRAVTDPDLAQLLNGCAADRREAAEELAGILASLGENTHQLPSVGGEMHRGWIALRGVAAHGGAPAGIIAECERGEHIALARYDRALAQKLPMTVANVLLDQQKTIRDTREALERMRHPW
jgi:uncharacterized protein (TIGR02284 family)